MSIVSDIRGSTSTSFFDPSETKLGTSDIKSRSRAPSETSSCAAVAFGMPSTTCIT